MSRYKVKGLPWNTGIGRDVSAYTSSRDVIKEAELDWSVRKCELRAEMPFTVGGDNKITDNDKLNGVFARDGFIYRTLPEAYATYRTDKNIPLGLVKSKYEVVQNIDAFNFFDDAIGQDKAIWQRAGQFGYGHRVFLCAKLPIEITINGDPIDNYLVFSNSHDGTSSITIMFTPIRVICTNMLNSAIHSSDSFIRIRHTQSAKDKLERGGEILKIACEHAKDAEQLYSALYACTMKDYQVLQYISNLLLTAKEIEALNKYDHVDGYKRLLNKEYLIMEATGISMRKINQIASIYEYYHAGVGQDKILGTAWGAYNAITGYWSNVDEKNGERRMDNLLYGSGNAAMQKALVSVYDIAKIA